MLSLLISAWPRTRHEQILVYVVVLHVVVWWTFALILFYPSDLHNDMVEAFSWGRELQLGYFKHPPLWAWICAIWFSVFPTADWAFYLLSVTNSTVGLIGVWMIAGRFVTGRERLAAVLLLELVPFFNFLAFNYNANSIQLSLWPWTAYIFLISLERRSLISAAIFGILAAMLVLSKYSAGILLVCCLIASITHSMARDYWKSAAPFLSMIVFLICIAPHAAWCVYAPTGPMHNLATRTAFPFLVILNKAVLFFVGCVLFHSLLALVFVILFEPRHLRLKELVSGLRARQNGSLAILSFGPFVLMAIISIVGNVKITTNSAIPFFPFVPLALIVLLQLRFDAQKLRSTLLSVKLLMAGSLMMAVPVAAAKFKANSDHYNEPRSLVARQLNELWRERYRAPLRVVAGSESYALAATFYGPDHPSEFTNFSSTDAPWISPLRLEKQGLAIICVHTDVLCMDRARKWKGLTDFEQTIHAQKPEFLRAAGQAQAFHIMFVAPGQGLTQHSPKHDDSDMQAASPGAWRPER
ncbi:glycosyltransferase family 39 protein [Boseaceae bacterium BT-24-1]|nr:glycosyltransferase family 39 protein [Boseaceae bacterium BT-24-1]